MPDEVLRCSFCNKDHDDVRKLIAGPEVYICDECVQVCVDIIADDQRPSDPAEDAARANRPRATELALPENAIACTLCGAKRFLKDMLPIQNRGVLCGACADTVEDALARGTPTS